MEYFINFILALCPIIWLVFALIVLKMQAHIASFFAFLVSCVISFFMFDMSLTNMLLSTMEGIAMALWPIVLVIIAAVFTYNLTVYSKSMKTIQKMLTSVSNDIRVLVLLIGWCFGGFLEGMAGFGTAIAIPASMLFGLGLNPITAILVCLVANGTPTPFGSIGIPTVTLANLVSLEQTTLSFAYSLQCALFMFMAPFLMILITSKSFKGLKGMIPITFISSISFVIPVLIVSKYVGAELSVIVASVCSLIATFLFATFTNNQNTPKEYCIETKQDEERITLIPALKAWSPLILIFVLLLV
ncbi:MAG: L-lactate permease, partial [Traorella sp.]